ncbi:MAG: hypothetical protein FDX30_10685 [Chlorobium sp.]|nr:MAG: hypothetical protein FDX30_10685 [Chlorobium sp.]
MRSEKLTVLVGGYIGLLHSGGIVWDYIQYLLGFLEMGHDVYYLEDTMCYPVCCSTGDDSYSTIQRLQTIMEEFGVGDRWIYRDEVTKNIYGKSEEEYITICRKADILINVSWANVMREEYLRIPVRILLDSDPMFTQIQIHTKQESLENAYLYTHHFSFGENINSPDCLVPTSPFSWIVTRQPICLEYWPVKDNGDRKKPYTTVMNWNAGKPLEYDGREWGQKNLTFPIILDVPAEAKRETFTMAVNKLSEDDHSRLTKAGWQIVLPDIVIGDYQQYQSFINDSKAEISVAKETYVKANTGWFSGRSACYLAAGRPVITQDTCWSRYYPAGNGLFSFVNKSEALDAVREISANWKHHSKSAREIAESFFDHRKVLGDMLKAI